jgi:hypothetical protein
MNKAIPLVQSSAILAFHAQCTANRSWAKSGECEFAEGAWSFIELNHRFNNLLWDEEDLARRTDVADADIAANKRAIDRYNQNRNNAIEKIDECILTSLAGIAHRDDARLNSETAGSMIDRMSILSLKVFHMGLQLQRTDVDAAHIESCAQKRTRLCEQRDDLAGCLDNLLAECQSGRGYYKIYRQFKMYNDPTLNPYLYHAAGEAHAKT